MDNGGAPRCPRCGALPRLEPATVCCSCGEWDFLDGASEEEKVRQRVLDWALRPRSVECLAPWNASDYIGPLSRLRLPDGSAPAPRRATPPAKKPVPIPAPAPLVPVLRLAAVETDAGVVVITR